MFRLKSLLLAFLLLLAFFFGAITVHYTWFPYTYFLKMQESLKYKKEQGQSQLVRSYPYYDRKVSQQEYFKAQYFDVIFLGDSITDEMNWSAAFPEKSTINLGINGDTTAGVLKRLESIINIQADQMFLMIGINDLFRGRSVQGILERYQLIITSLQSSVNTLYVQSVLPVTYRNFELDTQIQEINRALERMASEYTHVIYVDLYSKMEVDGVLNQEYTNDGIHLTADGYAVWLDTITPFIN